MFPQKIINIYKQIVVAWTFPPSPLMEKIWNTFVSWPVKVKKQSLIITCLSYSLQSSLKNNFRSYTMIEIEILSLCLKTQILLIVIAVHKIPYFHTPKKPLSLRNTLRSLWNLKLNPVLHGGGGQMLPHLPNNLNLCKKKC